MGLVKFVSCLLLQKWKMLFLLLLKDYIGEIRKRFYTGQVAACSYGVTAANAILKPSKEKSKTLNILKKKSPFT